MIVAQQVTNLSKIHEESVSYLAGLTQWVK